MSRTTIARDAWFALKVPRGWFVLAAALISWLLVVCLWLGVSQLAGAPSIDAVRKTSVARVSRIIRLCGSAAIASRVAMKRVPI